MKNTKNEKEQEKEWKNKNMLKEMNEKRNKR